MNVDNISKERFEKAKKGIIKKYPGAKTMVDHMVSIMLQLQMVETFVIYKWVKL